MSRQVANIGIIDLSTARAERACRARLEVAGCSSEGRGEVVDGGNGRLVESAGVGEDADEGAVVGERQDGAGDRVGGRRGLGGDLLPGSLADDGGHDLDGGALDGGGDGGPRGESEDNVGLVDIAGDGDVSSAKVVEVGIGQSRSGVVGVEVGEAGLGVGGRNGGEEEIYVGTAGEDGCESTALDDSPKGTSHSVGHL